jgi:anti-sigma-K factor RskA
LSPAGENDVRALLPSYVAGDLSPEDRSLVERRLAEDPALEPELREWNEVFGRLAEAAGPAIVPSVESRRAVLDRIADDETVRGGAQRTRTLAPPTPPSPRRRSGALAVVALAASIASLVVGLLALRLHLARSFELGSLRADRQRLERQVAALEQQLDGANRRLDRLAAAMRAATFPGREPIVLAGLDSAPGASGATFYHPSAREAVFHAYGLPRLTPDRTYQLWYIVDGGPVSAGTFAVDDLGEATVAVAGLPEPSRIAAWAVSLEAAGGVAQPTGPIVASSG